MHDIWGPIATLVIVIIGVLFNGRQISELRNEMAGQRGEMQTAIKELRTELRSEIRDLRTEVLARIDALQRDITELVREQGRHDARLDALEARQQEQK